jgi:hypothetical protein
MALGGPAPSRAHKKQRARAPSGSPNGFVGSIIGGGLAPGFRQAEAPGQAFDPIIV